VFEIIFVASFWPPWSQMRSTLSFALVFSYGLCVVFLRVPEGEEKVGLNIPINNSFKVPKFDEKQEFTVHKTE